MIKKYIVCIILLFVFALSGCNDYMTKDDYPNYVIRNKIEHFEDFVDEVNQYAKTIDDELSLGSIQIVFKQLDFDDCIVSISYGKIIDEKSKRLNFDYDSKLGKITYTEYSYGLSKAIIVASSELYYKNWDVDLQKCLEIIKSELKQRSIEKFDRILCDCQDDLYWVNVFVTAESTDSVEFFIPNRLSKQ